MSSSLAPLPPPPLAPAPAPARLPRAALLELDQGQPLVVIEAPAGHGKSVLARQWLDTRPADAAAAWLALDAASRAPAVFAARLQAALETGSSIGIGVDAANAADFDALCRHLQSRTAPLWLVLDDCQQLIGSASARSLERLLALASSRLRLCLTTQALRLGVGLGAKVADGAVLWLPAARLAFTRHEIAALARLRGRKLSAAQLEALQAATGGWPSLVQIALSMPADPDSAEPLAGSNALREYLGDRFLDALDGTERALLWQIGCLGQPPVALLAALAPTSLEIEAALRRLRALGIVEDCRAQDGAGVQLPRLLREALVALLTAPAAAARSEVLQAAAGWYWRHGRGVEALRTALDGGAALQEQARRWLAGFGLELVFRMGQHQTLLDLVGRWEAIAGRHCPAVDTVAAWALLFQRHFAAAIVRIDRVDAADHADHRSAALLLRAVLAGLRDEPEQCSRLADAWIRQHQGAHDFGMAVASTVSAFSHKCAGEPSAAQAALREAFYSFNLAQSAYGLGWVDVVGALALVHTGRYRAALAQLDTGLQRCQGDQGFGITRALLRAIEACVRYERGELAIVEGLLGEVLDVLPELGVVDVMAFGFTAAARMRGNSGNFGAALDLLSEAEQVGLRLDLPRLVTLMQAERALLLLRAGSTLRARALLDAIPPRDAATAPIRLLRGRLAIAEGEPAAALCLLEPVQAEARADQRLLLQCEALLLRAQAEDLLGNEPQALAAIGEALELAGSEGYVRSLIDDRRALAALAQRWLDADLAAPQTARALARQLAGDRNADPADLGSPARAKAAAAVTLNPRQRAILVLLNQGLSNSQLAERCLLSESTVKWYLHHLYETFGVANRTALLRAVREQGLVL